MTRWLDNVIAGLDRAIEQTRSNATRPLVRTSVAAPSHTYALTPAIGFAPLGESSGCPFRVLRRSPSGGEEFVDLDHAEVAKLTWTIKVANAKLAARRRRRELVLEPGIVTIGGRGRQAELARADREAMPVGIAGPEGIVSLGRVETDAAGNLIVYAAAGRLASATTAGPAADEHDCFDDECDGWVRAELLLRSGVRVLACEVASAWFVGAEQPLASLPERIDPDLIAPGTLVQAHAIRI